MIYRTASEEVSRRLDELVKLLREPSTIDQLAEKTGRSKKMVYKDLGKLAYRGYRLMSKLGIYWIEPGGKRLYVRGEI